MKKSIAILSMALLAGNAFAADVLEAGTAAAPKYYVIKANRGIPYVTYTATAKTSGTASTTLYRANGLSEAAVWAVLPGSTEGTISIYNYTTRNDENKAYMFSFANGLATTTAEAQDVFVKNNGNGSYGLALMNETGVYNGAFYALDATGGTSEFMGNWQNIADGGTQWWCYAVDVTNGVEAGLAAVQTPINKDNMANLIASYSSSMTTYATAVPWVADDLNAGIAALGKLEYSDDYEDKVAAVWNEYIGKANATLNTLFNGKLVAFENQRRKANGKAKPFISVGETNYPGAENYASDLNAIFTLEGTTYNGSAAYYMYNAATSTYYGADKAPVATKEEACPISFTLNSNSGFTGVNIIANSVSGSMNGLNVDQNGNPLTYWYPADGGSIWSILEADEASITENVISANVEKLQPYVDKVPAEVANVLNAGINEIKALTFSLEIAKKAEAIVATTIAAANELLTYGVHGTTVNIYYPRGNRYLGYSAESSDWVAATSNNSNNEIFTIRNVEGGVILYNQENNVFVGPAVLNGNQYDVEPVTEKAEATVFTVELNNNSGFYGVSFVFNEVTNAETGATRERALNMNLNAKCLHTYGKADGGSIFQLQDKEIEPTYTPATGEAVATYNFLTDQYGYNVESGNSSSYLPADAEFLEVDGRCHITIDKKSGAGVRFWQASSGVELRVMKNSAITISVPQGDILGVEFTANNNANKFTSSNSDLMAFGGTTKLCTFANIGGTVSTVTFTASDRVDLTQVKVTLEGGVSYIPVVPAVREDAGLAIEGGETVYTAVLGEEFVAPVITKETFSKLTFTSSNTEVAEIDADGSNLKIIGVGTAVITATAPENDDYNAGKISYTINVLPEGVIFTSAMGEDFTFEPDTDIWVHDATYGLKGTGYIGAPLNMNIVAEAIAVSPEITIPAGSNATLYFDQAINYLKGNPIAENCNVVVRVTDEGEAGGDDDFGGYYDTDAEWVLIENAVTAPASDSWTFYANAPVDLTAYAGKTIQIGFKYNSTNAVACTWEVKNIMVSAIDPLKDAKAAAIAELTKYFAHIPGDHSWELASYRETIEACEDVEAVNTTLQGILNQLASYYANNLEVNFFFAVGDKFGAYVKPEAEGANAWQVVNELGSNTVFAGKRVNERSWMPWSATDAEGETATERESNNEDAMMLYNVLTGYYLGQPTAAGEAIPVVEDEAEAGYWFVKATEGQFAIADDANGDLYLFWDETKGLIASETAATFPVDEIPLWDNGYCDYYVSVIVPNTSAGEWGNTVTEELNTFDVCISTAATLSGIGGIECCTYDSNDEKVVLNYVSAAQLAEMTPEKGTGIYKKTVGWSPTGAIYEDIEFEANIYHLTAVRNMGRAEGDEEPAGITTPGNYVIEVVEGTWIVADENEGKLFSPEVHLDIQIEGEIAPKNFAIESDPVSGTTLEEISSIFICPESGFCTIVWTNPAGTNIVFSSGENVIKTWTPDEVQLCAVEKEDWQNDPDIFELKLDETITAAGTYSLYIPEGFFENDNSKNAETILTWTIEEGEDGITTITINGNDTIYDLQGRRMNAAAKGIFIINGKKVLVK